MLIVKDVYEKKFATIPARATMREVAEVMTADGVGHVLVEDGDGELTGIVTESDFVRKVTAADRIPYVTRAATVMSSPLISIDIHANSNEALDLMDRHKVLHLAVRDNGKVVGMVSVRDLIHDYERPESGGKYWAS